MAEFVRDDLTDMAFPVVAPDLMPELFALFMNTQIPNSIRTSAVSIVGEFSDIIYMVKEEQPQAVEQFLEPLLRMWYDGFVAILSEEGTGNNRSIKDQVLKTIVKIVRGFPKQTVNIILPLMEIVWSQLVALQPIYEQQFVRDVANDINEEDQNGIESIIYSSLDFIQLVCRKHQVKPIFSKSLKGIINVLLTFLQITVDMESSWLANMNLFVQDDEHDAVGHSVRIAVNECLDVVLINA